DAGDEAQRAGPRHGGHPAGDPGGVPHRIDGAAGSGARRHPEGRVDRRGRVALAGVGRAGRLQADGSAQPAAGPRGRADDPRGDAAEIGRSRRADLPSVGDARDVIAQLGDELAKQQMAAGGVPDRAEWLGQRADWKKRYPYRYEQPEDGPIKPQLAVERLYEAT